MRLYQLSKTAQHASDCGCNLCVYVRTIETKRTALHERLLAERKKHLDDTPQIKNLVLELQQLESHRDEF